MRSESLDAPMGNDSRHDISSRYFRLAVDLFEYSQLLGVSVRIHAVKMCHLCLAVDNDIDLELVDNFLRHVVRGSDDDLIHVSNMSEIVMRHWFGIRNPGSQNVNNQRAMIW